MTKNMSKSSLYAGNNNSTEWLEDLTDIVSKFSLRTAEVPDDDLCYIVPGQPLTIPECEFNPETQTFVVIHGWTVKSFDILL
jgi:lipoprotein lipase